MYLYSGFLEKRASVKKTLFTKACKLTQLLSHEIMLNNYVMKKPISIE